MTSVHTHSSCRPAGDPARRSAAAAPDLDAFSTRLVVCDDLTLESEDETHVTVVNNASAARLKLSRVLYQFLLRFCAPRTVEDAVNAVPSDPLLRQVRTLVNRNLLVYADVPAEISRPRLRNTVAYKFCNAPGYTSASVSDFVVLGVPYDFGGRLDCRTAPEIIRKQSLDYTYQLRLDNGLPKGWLDVNDGRRILEGASIVDAGDVHVEYGENQHDLFARIDSTLDDVCATGTVPVVLGGDRSVTYAVVNNLRKRKPLTVVQFAKTPAVARGDNAEVIAANNAGRRLAALQGVEGYIAVGVRDVGSNCGADRLIASTPADLRREGVDAIVGQLGTDSDVYLSIDLSVTTAEYVESDASGKSLGLTFAEIKELIAALGRSRRIAGIDLVGLDTATDPAAVSCVAACQLALESMSAAHDRIRGVDDGTTAAHIV